MCYSVPMSKISHDTTKHMARLARIAISEDEIDHYSNQLSSILDFVEQLQAVDTGSVEPKLQINGLVNVFRDDVVTNKPETEQLLANAPMQTDGLLKVKSVRS